jgi:predicted DNA-binding transcriptional regulator AlpA
MADIPGHLLTEPEAARYLRLSPHSLRGFRYRRQGPSHIKMGGKKIAYRLSDLEAWVEARCVDNSQEPLPPRLAGATAAPRRPVGRPRKIRNVSQVGVNAAT